MHQSIESPGGGGPGWGGDSAPTFCTILHSPRPPRHIFLSLIPAPGAHFLKAHIHISSYESNKLQEQDAALKSCSLSDPMRGDFCILPSSCPAPGSHWLRPCFSIGWQRSLPAPSSVVISSTPKLLCYPITLTTAGVDDPDSQWRRPLDFSLCGALGLPCL